MKNVASYIILHNSTNVLCKDLLDLNIVKKVGFISEEAKNHTRKQFKMKEKSINLVFHIQVVVKHIVAKVVEVRDILFQDETLKKYVMS